MPTCRLCGTPFPLTRTNQMYCSRRHAAAMAQRFYYRRNPQRVIAKVKRWKASKRATS